MSDWPKYESHKIVQAARIARFETYPGGGTGRECAIVHGPDGDERFNPTVPDMLNRAEVGDWAMLYPDGFRSISPAKAFEDGYTPCP